MAFRYFAYALCSLFISGNRSRLSISFESAVQMASVLSGARMLCLRQAIVLVSTFLLVENASALTLNIKQVYATPTCHNIGLHSGLPQVTPAPKYQELRRRQQSSGVISSSTTSEVTCGFINGDADRPVTCGTSLYCATTSTFVGCCELTNCRDIFTSCFDLLGSSCDQSCQANPQNLVW